MSRPLVSFIISTYNRQAALLRTLSELHGPASPACPVEILVVDNASTDSTVLSVRRHFPRVTILPQPANLGPVAKNAALPQARGQYVVFLDDDSFPAPGAIDRMASHFAADDRLGAAVFTVTLPDGSRECSAYPDVFIGCGVGLRRTALDQVGGLPEEFFMQAEEYDLSLRLLDAGWTVRTFDDLHVTHLKTPAARFPGRVMRLDVRNNLRLIGRYFPDRWILPFARDWIIRYRMIASANDCLPAFYRGLAQGLAGMTTDSRRPVSPRTFERFARMEQIETALRRAVEERQIRQVLFIDVGKNIFPYWSAARAAKINVAAIADARLGGRGFKYRGIPIIPDADAASLSFDAAVISNLSPVHAASRRSLWQSRQSRPVLDLLKAA